MTGRPHRAAIATALCITWSTPAAAQHHHHSGGDESTGDAGIPALHVAAGLSVEAGHVEAFGETRAYQGLALMAAARLRSVELAAHVPFYRIELGPEPHSGVGDVHLGAGWVAFRSPVELGLIIGVMPPFGGDEHGLAMGHWMVMGGGFARASRGRASGSATLGYGGTLEGEGHADHGVPVWPPVAPMNAHEIGTTLEVQVATWRTLAAFGSAALAAPLGDGDFVGSAGGGAAAQLGRLELRLGVRHGLLAHTAGLVVASQAMISF